MKKTAAAFLCLVLGSATFASAPNAPLQADRKATAAPAGTPVARSGKADTVAAKGTAAAAPEALRDPYSTPLLLNAKPLMIGRP